MAAAFVQKTAKATAGNATSVTTAALTTTTGNALVLTCASWCSNTSYALSPSDSKANTWTVGSRVTGGTTTGEGKAIIAMAEAIANAGSSHTGTVTSTINTTYFECNLSEFSGVAAATALDVSNSDVGGASDTTTTVTTGSVSQNDTLEIACISLDGGSGGATISDPPTGYTKIDVNPQNNTEGYQASYKITSASGTRTVTWNFDALLSSGGNVGLLAVYKASGGGGGGGGSAARMLLLGVS